MQIHNVIPRTKNKKTMLVGRGGKRGKTAGRGTKGQNARAGRKKRPELRDFIKRIPKLRGRGVNSNKSFELRPIALNLDVLEKKFNAGDAVSPKILVEKNVLSLVKGKFPLVKILSNGELTKKLSITGCTFSVGAKVKIEKAGGSII